MLKVSNSVCIPMREIGIKSVLSQGSGGQNVNKVSTAVQLFFNVNASSLPEGVKERLLACSDHRMTDRGVVVIKAQEARTQEANKEAALERLKQLVQSVLVVPKKRRSTKPTKGSKERRLRGKTIRGNTKAMRGKPSAND